MSSLSHEKLYFVFCWSLHLDVLFAVSYLPSPVNVTPSPMKKVSGTPLNSSRKLTKASSDREMLRKVRYLKSDIIELWLPIWCLFDMYHLLTGGIVAYGELKLYVFTEMT